MRASPFRQDVRVVQAPSTGMVPSPKVLRQLMRALNRASKDRNAVPRSGRPRGGKQNYERIHTERYGKGSVTGKERDWGKLTAAERQFSRQLANQGFHIRLIPTRRDRRTPDFEVNGVKFELKTLQSFGQNTVRRNLQSAYGQNPDIIIINCRNVEANREAVMRQIRTAERELETSLENKIIVWMNDGTTISY